MPFLSAWGCCLCCGRVVACRAATCQQAEGSRPYRHKAERGPGLPWCPGSDFPALHYRFSRDRDRVALIEETEEQVRRLRGG